MTMMNNGGDFDPSFMVKQARRQQQLYENMQQQQQERQRQNEDEFQYHQQPQNGIYQNNGAFSMNGGAGMSHPNFNPPQLNPFAMMQRQQQQQQHLFNLQRHHHGGPNPIPGQNLFAAAAAMNHHAMTNGMNPAMNPAINRMQSAINPLAALSAMNAMNASSSTANNLNNHFAFQPNNQFQAQDHHNNPFASQHKDDQQLHTSIAQFPLIPPNHSELNPYADFHQPPENPTMTSKAQIPLFRPKSTSPLMNAAATIAAARAAAVAANLIIPPDLPAVHQSSSPTAAIAPHTSSASATTSALPPLAVNKKKDNNDKWLEGLQIKCSDISVEPLSGKEVVSRVRVKTDNVVTRYLPCVEFLVACQQDLRTAPKRSTKQFFTRYLAPLPDRFFSRNRHLMEPSVLEVATAELQKLVADAKKVQKQGCEIMKNTFLGGMKDGESWGLRKWLSKQGGALHICNDLECILRSCQDLDRSLSTTKQLSDRLRPFAKNSLDRLRSDVPPSYQEISKAHPYLPFFHRLEAALRSMSNFDPEDDDVICIDDDDEIAEAQEAKKAKEAHLPKKKRAVDPQIEQQASKRQRLMMDYDEQLGAAAAAAAPTMVAYDDSDDDDVIEVIDIKQAANNYAPAAIDPSPFAPAPFHENDWECPRCTMLNAGEINRCCMCDETRDGDDQVGNNSHETDDGDETTASPSIATIVQNLQQLAHQADYNRHNCPVSVSKTNRFWDSGPRYASALRLLVDILKQNFPLDHPSEYQAEIKHPLCFGDIVNSLLREKDGILPRTSYLAGWNMWCGMDLLQAMDLVFLNHMISQKSATIKNLRKSMWRGIHNITKELVDVEKRRQCTPQKRSETSGFVIRK